MSHNKYWNGSKRTKEYTASLIYQLEQWRDGNPVHNSFSDECCPDFSCCHSEMLTEDKQRIEQANNEIAKLREVM